MKDMPKHKFDGAPYQLANRKFEEAWAYNETAKSVKIFIQNRKTNTVTSVLVRKEVLRRLAALP